MPAPAYQELQYGVSDGVNTVVSAALTAADNHLYIATIHTEKSSAPAVSSIAGLGLTWSLVKAQCSGLDEHRTEVWYAIGSPTVGAVTATLSATADGADITVTRWSGVKVATPIGASSSYNTNGSGGACSGGVDNDDATGSIAVQAAGSVVLVAVSSDEDFAHTSGWTAHVSNLMPGTPGLVQASVETKVIPGVGATTVGAANNLSGVNDWSLVAVEIVGAAAVATARTLARLYDPHTGRPLRDLAAWQ